VQTGECVIDDQRWPCDAIREADRADDALVKIRALTILYESEAARADKAEAALAECRQQERERLRERDPFGDDWNRPYKMPEKWDTPLELLYHFQEWLLADPSDD